MKIINKRPRSRTVIKAASESGTIFYKITLDDVNKVYDDPGVNSVLKEAFALYGWEIFDVDKMWGSAVVDDVLYLCRTDGHEIEVAGDMVDPETAIEDYGLDEVSHLIQDSSPEIIRRYLSGYEIAHLDLDEVAMSLLRSGFKFSKIVKDAYDLDLLDDVI